MKSEWKSPFDWFYRVTDNEGHVRLETINFNEAQDYMKKNFEESGVIMLIEQIKR